jgi:hypothetical protein
MGAWSHTSFGNDDALDFIAEVEEDGEAAVANAFEVVNFLKPDDYLEAPDASVAIAAAELVAARGGKPPADFPPQAAAVVPRIKERTTHVADAIKAVRRILDYSELKELWAESQEFDKWRADVADLLERLK